MDLGGDSSDSEGSGTEFADMEVLICVDTGTFMLLLHVFVPLCMSRVQTTLLRCAGNLRSQSREEEATAEEVVRTTAMGKEKVQKAKSCQFREKPSKKHQQGDPHASVCGRAR
jgi:hypothetical protein